MSRKERDGDGDYTQPLELFTDPSSEPCRSVHWLALEIDTPLTLIPTWLGMGQHTSPEFLQVNPRHQVPAFRHGVSFCLSESLAIMHYLCEIKGPPCLAEWFGSDPQERARILQCVSWHQHAVRKAVMLEHNLPLYYVPFYMGEGKAPRPDPASLRGPRFHESLAQLEHFLQKGGGYLVGSRLTVADIVVAPDITAMDADPEAEKVLSPYPKILEWLQRLRTRPAFQRAHAGFEGGLPEFRRHFRERDPNPGDPSALYAWTDPWILNQKG
uniref:GST C-terminal domain-containing protein n=1 Tax=Chromera velia CCMP2878 TaxID=1169474 RepID=A0A0G4I2E9_9ALVE|eukprot:Cvel_1695.t1-p1 / transcript=Cvel_1695.t1 / gene=Cvel_1695 / organism=Chromera_velia_CCMP2878 / gene_product=Glutathione S-transferase theta-1, putative / transcript_product=Glutathione S-transferase theta-1, putative / location=Cvel_scaffold61:18339-19145(-) / protein_length=269 / sequence_SO=supercontig / SO=protein_coding / is_pseudo=false